MQIEIFRICQINHKIAWINWNFDQSFYFKVTVVLVIKVDQPLVQCSETGMFTLKS